MDIEAFAQIIRDNSDGELTGVSTGILVLMVIVVGILVIISALSFFVSLYLWLSYVKYNRRKNSKHQTGEQIARNVLDRNGLYNIKVSATGSIMFGNSYSHYFKKVRLRRLTWRKTTVTSLAMAEQKAHLAVLDKEGDPDMRKRVKLTPIIYFGPLAMIPLLLIGMLLDYFIFKSSSGVCTAILTVAGVLLYVVSFVMSLMVLKTEKKAQRRAIRSMREEGFSHQDIADCERLFHLYNIEYVNDMITALLELVYRALQLVAYAQNSKNCDK